MGDTSFRHELAEQLRVDSVRASAAAGSGHPTSSMSAADLMAVLLDGLPAEPTGVVANHGNGKGVVEKVKDAVS